MNLFRHTRRAMREFDRTRAERQKIWDTIDTVEDCNRAEQVDAIAMAALREAFFLDTSDINSLENCYIVGMPFLRVMADLGFEREFGCKKTRSGTGWRT